MIYTVTLNPTLDRSLTVPKIAFDEVLRSSVVHLDPSGKGLNVSLALKEFGCPTTAMGFMGGATGMYLENCMAAAGIQSDFVHIAGETRSNVVIIEEATQHYVKANEPGPTVSSSEQQTLVDQISGRVQSDDFWIFSGSLPPGVPDDFYATLIDLVQAKGSRAVLDTSGEVLRQGLRAKPNLIKPNSLEAEQGSGIAVRTIEDAFQAGRYFLNLGVPLVAISMGADGLVMASAGLSIVVHPPDVPVRNPTAAGDSLLAGIVWALQQDLTLIEAARWGVASGTASAMQDGSGVGPRQLVEALYPQVTDVQILSDPG